jgi:GntR family transcriptional repressor for pyruvate dehydrogenase complex
MFRPAQPRRAFDEITSQVRDLVRRGELATGDRLPSERALAEQFQVSRNTVREAMRMLEVAGLVELRRGASGGAFIARANPHRVALDISDMIGLSVFSFTDLAEARLGVESVVVRLACERRDDDDLAAMEHNIELVALLTQEGKLQERAAANVEFDNLLAAAAKNPVLTAFMRSISAVSREVVNTLGVTEGDVVLRSHRLVLKHVRARNADAAVAELERHVNRIHKHWVDGEYSRKRRTAPAAAGDA